MIDRTLLNAVAALPTTVVEGDFFRHASKRERAPEGSPAGGRWGPVGGYPVIYLGRPEVSVVGEAYRHIVDAVEGMRPELVAARHLMRCELRVTNVVDLTDPAVLQSLALDPEDLRSEIGDYERCIRVGQAAHQLGFHGILAPSATALGETLALFAKHLPEHEHPVVAERRVWEGLPADPRDQSQIRASDLRRPPA